MYSFFHISILTAMLMFTSQAWSQKLDEKLKAKKVIKAAEEIRSLNQSKSKVRIDTFAGKKKTSYEMDILQGTDRRAYLEFTAPDEERGRRMLAIKTSYWSKFPDSKRVVTISRREAIGNSAFAIADVFQMDTEEDYNATILGEETISGALCYKVQLDAKHEGAPYFRIIYFVRKNDSYPVVAHFMGPSGQKLKTMTVEKSEMIAGRIRPSILKMIDETTRKKFSIWMTINVEKTNVPEEVFTQAYLKGR